MRIEASSPDKYMSKIPDDRKKAMTKLRNTILENLPVGFEETINYGMIGYVVPKSVYPDGYHCNPDLPLPFMSIASQKNFIAFYHHGIYADKTLLDWFVTEYNKQFESKPDMGKSCVRFTKTSEIPFNLIACLVQKVSVDQWIQLYKSNVKK